MSGDVRPTPNEQELLAQIVNPKQKAALLAAIERGEQLPTADWDTLPADLDLDGLAPNPGLRRRSSGKLVRLKSDPGRHGVLTGRLRERRGTQRAQVRFMDGTSSYVPEDQIEPVGDDPQDPLDLLQAGRLGTASDLRRTLTHVRLTGRLANVIYSMDTTGTDFYAYQFKPVVKLLNSASTGILIADEVGLGKTIEAGLIWTELRSRFDFRRIFVLCPAVLREKWQRELNQRFGVSADILKAPEALTRLQRAAEEGPTSQFAIIASMQGLRPRRGWEDHDPAELRNSSAFARFLSDRGHEEPLVDLAVIDEAHYLRNPKAMTTALGHLLRNVSHYMLLLSATPIHLRSRDLFQLVNLLDPDTFDHPQAFDDILDANAPLVRLRDAVVTGQATPESLASGIDEARRHSLLRGNRQLESIRSQLPTVHRLRDPHYVSELAYRLETANLLGHVVTRTRKRDVTEWRVVRDVKAEAIPLSDLEQEFYQTVTNVVREYCARREAHEGFLLVMPQRQMSSSMPAALQYWRERQAVNPADLYEDLGIDESTDDIARNDPGPLVQELIARVDELGDLDLLRKHDSKYRRLRECLRAFFSSNCNQKVIIFSYFRNTLAYLRERLMADGVQCVVLQGGMDDPDAVIREFRDREGPIVLLSSEVGSEGIDLQFAWAVINYDLPWNPMRVEQRIGRVDRLGQQSPKVVVWNLFCEGTIDARIYRRLFERLEIFTHALGPLEAVLGDRIRDLTMELLRNQLTPQEEEERIEQTRRALENIQREEEILEENAAHLVAYGDYILNHVKAARELHRRIDGRDIQTYVLDFFKLRYPGCEFRQIADDAPDFEISLSNEAKHTLEAYLKEQRLEGQTQLTRNDLRTVACRFENSAIPRRTGRVEIISQFHPVVRFTGHEIAGSGEYFHPAIAARVSVSAVPESVREGVYVFSVQRWSLRGLQDIERIYFAAARLSTAPQSVHPDLAEQLVVATAVNGMEWLGAEEQVELGDAVQIANDDCLANSDEAFEDYVRETQDKNDDRADVQERTLDKHYTNQMRRLEETREKHERLGRTGLTRATEGRMRALTNRVERKRMDITDRRQVTSRKDEICVGLIEVVAGT